MAIDHDGLFKELLTTFFAEFIELFAPGVLLYGDVADMTLAGTEAVKDTSDVGQRRADLVIQMRRTEYGDSPLSRFERTPLSVSPSVLAPTQLARLHKPA